VEEEKPHRDFTNIFLSVVPTAILHSKKKLQKLPWPSRVPTISSYKEILNQQSII
jgi:hypothetical protein